MKLQQGDVLIKKVDYEVDGKKLNHMTLAEGEATGHHHSIVSGLGQLVMMDRIMHLQVFSDTALLKPKPLRTFSSLSLGRFRVNAKIRFEQENIAPVALCASPVSSTCKKRSDRPLRTDGAA